MVEGREEVTKPHVESVLSNIDVHKVTHIFEDPS